MSSPELSPKTKVWLAGMNFLKGKKGYLEASPGDPKYLKLIIHDKARAKRYFGLNGVDLIMEFITSANPNESTETYYIPSDGKGSIKKEIRDPISQEVKEHSLSDEEIGNLLKDLEGSRSLEESVAR